jgi:D-lyxose ketol-isomerase
MKAKKPNRLWDVYWEVYISADETKPPKTVTCCDNKEQALKEAEKVELKPGESLYIDQMRPLAFIPEDRRETIREVLQAIGYGKTKNVPVSVTLVRKG